MKHLFVPYPLALKAKGKGFDEECFGIYDPNLFVKPYINQKEAEAYFGGICAPIYQQLIDWFRDVHKIHIGLVPHYDVFYYLIKDFKKDKELTSDISDYKSYYELYNKALEEAFKLI